MPLHFILVYIFRFLTVPIHPRLFIFTKLRAARFDIKVRASIFNSLSSLYPTDLKHYIYTHVFAELFPSSLIESFTRIYLPFSSRLLAKNPSLSLPSFTTFLIVTRYFQPFNYFQDVLLLLANMAITIHIHIFFTLVILFQHLSFCLGDLIWIVPNPFFQVSSCLHQDIIACFYLNISHARFISFS